jgi:hypothetical protein
LTRDRQGRLAVTGPAGKPRLDLGLVVDQNALTLLSNDGKHVLTVGKDHEAIVCRAGDGKRLLRTRPQRQLDGLALSPDGRRLLTVAGGEALLWDVASGRAIDDLRRPGDQGLQPFVVHAGRAQVLCAAWEVQPEQRPAEELLREAEVLSGRRLEEDRLVDLSKAALRARLRRQP